VVVAAPLTAAPLTAAPLAADPADRSSRLVAADAIGAGLQGYCVALSADGNTAFMGAPHDNADIGAARVYARIGGVWAQQGSKLVGAGAVGATEQGWSAALSADGNTAIVSGYGDNTFTGAV
jgi:hypothetical protein